MSWDANALIGQQLGQFQIKDELGRGGMAVVYKGYQPSLDRWVAIKTLPTESAGNRDMVSRFHREAEAMVALNHTNIVQIIDKGEEGGLYYFAMEFVDGPTLQDLLKQEQMSMDLLFDVACQVCDGLEYAHRKGIVHRDMKPGNVLYEQSTGLAKIADFGIARLTKKPEEMITLTATNVGMGTMNYMAPEQKTDAGSVDHRADIYSVGVMIYEMFTGKLPMGRFKMPTQLNPQLPRKLDEVVTKCLDANPEDRYSDIGQLKTDLELARQASGGGTLMRSVRDAAERTLTAMGGGGSGGKVMLFGCFLLLVGALVGGAYGVKVLIDGQKPGPDVATSTSEPKTEGPKTEAPKTEAPKTEAPKTEGPKTEAPKTEGPKTEGPKTEGPKTEGPKTEGPKTEGPKTEGPKTEAPKTEAPKTEAPKTEAPKTEAPKTEAPKTEDPKTEDPKPSPTREAPAVSEETRRAIADAKAKLERAEGAIPALVTRWSLDANAIQGLRDDARRRLAEAERSPSDSSAAALARALEKLQERAAEELLDAYRALLEKTGAERHSEGLRWAEPAARRKAVGVVEAAPLTQRFGKAERALESLASARLEAARSAAEVAHRMALLRVGGERLGEGPQLLAKAKAEQSGGPVAEGDRYQVALKALLRVEPSQPGRVEAAGPRNMSPVAVGLRGLTHLRALTGLGGGRFAALGNKNGEQIQLVVFRVEAGSVELEGLHSVKYGAVSLACAGLDPKTKAAYLYVGSDTAKGAGVQRYELSADGARLAIDGGAKFLSREPLYDMDVDAAGTLYALTGARLCRLAPTFRVLPPIELGELAPNALMRRLAISQGGAMIVSDLSGANLGWDKEYSNPGRGSLSPFGFRLLRHVPGVGTGPVNAIGSSRNPSAVAALGDAFFACDYGHPDSIGRKGFNRLVKEPQIYRVGRSLDMLGNGLDGNQRPRLALEMAISGSDLVVLGAPLIPPNTPFREGRNFLFLYALK